MTQVPSGYDLRELRENDYSKGFLSLLGQLTTVGSVSEEHFKSNLLHLIG
jgi:hypothetical protein